MCMYDNLAREIWYKHSGGCYDGSGRCEAKICDGSGEDGDCSKGVDFDEALINVDDHLWYGGINAGPTDVLCNESSTALLNGLIANETSTLTEDDPVETIFVNASTYDAISNHNEFTRVWACMRCVLCDNDCACCTTGIDCEADSSLKLNLSYTQMVVLIVATLYILFN